ncbi:MAG: hypothetical protein V1914_01800 [archaeon]
MVRKLEDIPKEEEGTLSDKLNNLGNTYEPKVNTNYKNIFDYGDDCHDTCDSCDCHGCDCYYD